MLAQLRGIQLYFDVDGAGLVPDGEQMRARPTAFLVHGGPGTDHSGWKIRYGRLVERLQVVYFDHRGHGRSSRCDPSTYTLDENVEDMEALRRHLGIDRLVSIGGSYGGMVAMAHASRYPSSVSHLILISTASHSGNLLRAVETVKKVGTPEQIAQYSALLEGRIDTREKLQTYFEVMAPLYSIKHELKQAFALGPTGLEPDPFIVAYRPGGMLRNFDLRPELHRIRARTLILAGRHDWICPPQYGAEIHALIPESDFRIFEGSAHALGEDEPERFFDVIAGFLVYNEHEDVRRHATAP